MPRLPHHAGYVGYGGSQRDTAVVDSKGVRSKYFVNRVIDRWAIMKGGNWFDIDNHPYSYAKDQEIPALQGVDLRMQWRIDNAMRGN